MNKLFYSDIKMATINITWKSLNQA